MEPRAGLEPKRKSESTQVTESLGEVETDGAAKTAPSKYTTGTRSTRRLESPKGRYDPFNPYKQFNGVFIPEALLGMRAISPAAKLLYGQLSRRAGQDGNAYLSYGSLARDLGFSVRHVKKVAKELSDARLIEIRARADEHGRQWSNAFVFRSHEAFEPKPPAADPGGVWSLSRS